MKQGFLAHLGRALAAGLLSALTVAAQEPQAAPLSKLSLKVVVGHGRPTFYPLPDKNKQGAGGLFGAGQLPSARLLSGPPVDTVQLAFAREGSGARITVYAHRGSGESRESLKVAECFVSERQEYTVTQLAAYGVEPLTLSVVGRVEVELVPPRVDSRLQAVEVSEVKIHAEAPSFELVLRNVSDKEVRAIEIEEYRGMMSKGPPPMYDWRRTLPVKPGKTFSVTLEFGWNGKETPEGHAVEPPDRVQLKSVLFTDGSYEGDSRFAARAEALREGRKVQLKRVLELLRGLEETPADYASVQGLAQQVEMLDSTFEWPAVSAFAERYRVLYGDELERLKGLIESGMKSQRGIMLNEVNLFLKQTSPASDPAVIQRWLRTMREGYEKALALV
jgi:hypothetical protein